MKLHIRVRVRPELGFRLGFGVGLMLRLEGRDRIGSVIVITPGTVRLRLGFSGTSAIRHFGD